MAITFSDVRFRGQSGHSPAVDEAHTFEISLQICEVSWVIGFCKVVCKPRGAYAAFWNVISGTQQS
jgi:hypothetical protein